MKTQVIIGLLLGSLLLTGCEPEPRSSRRHSRIVGCQETNETRVVPYDTLGGTSIMTEQKSGFVKRKMVK